LVEREVGLTGRRVLDVGCGAGRLEEALAGRARIWGVDPSAEMLRVARDKVPDAAFKLGTAEALPFKDGWFERAVLWLAVHLVDRPRAFAELSRVLQADGAVAIVSFAEPQFSSHWLARFFPSLPELDRARFPTEDELRRELAAAGFGEVRALRLELESRLRREVALERLRARYISTFDLLDEEEIRGGTERAERELPDEIEHTLHFLLVFARR
jgi:ubiquinone/menaquinone biosynthesis C-methylase UbiE